MFKRLHASFGVEVFASTNAQAAGTLHGMHPDDATSSPAHAIAAVAHADPYPYYARLRAQAPLQRDAALGLWVASGAAVIEAAFTHAALRVRPLAEPVPNALRGTPAGEVFARLVRMNDGAFHAAHKPAVQQAARQWPLEQAAQVAAALTRSLARAGDPNALLTEVPVQAMAQLLGVEHAALAATSRWVHAFTQGIAPQAAPEAVAAASEAADALMAQGERAGLDPVRAANRIALMQQSLDATAGLIGNTVRLLLAEPHWHALARQTLAGARAIAAEIVRWDAPVQNTRRFVAEDCLLAGQTLRAGEGLVLVLASGNRDPALNPAPDTFEPSRAARRSLTFGAGAHQCPGEQLATEIAASCVHTLACEGALAGCFGRVQGYRPLGNARIPVFAPRG